jgi:hypothetical protein
VRTDETSLLKTSSLLKVLIIFGNSAKKIISQNWLRKILKILRNITYCFRSSGKDIMKSSWYCKIAVSYDSLILHDFSLSRRDMNNLLSAAA